MKTFNLTVSSPDGDIFKDEISAIFLRGTEGEFAILAGHTPFVTSVVPCECKIQLSDGSEKKANTEGGILTVSSDGATLLSGSFKWQ